VAVSVPDAEQRAQILRWERFLAQHNAFFVSLMISSSPAVSSLTSSWQSLLVAKTLQELAVSHAYQCYPPILELLLVWTLQAALPGAAAGT
jgi:hypothetical protein